MRQRISFFPEIIIIRVLYDFIPEEIVFVLLRKFAQRLHRFIPFKAVFGFDFRKLKIEPVVSGRLRMLNSKNRESQAITQCKSTVMMKIFKEKVSNRCLWRHSLQCRMTRKCSNYCVKSRVRYAMNTHPSIIIWYIFYQPIYGIVSVAWLIYIGGFGFGIHLRRHIGPGAFWHISAPNILFYKYKFLFHKRRRVHHFRHLILSIKPYRIAGSVHQNRIRISSRCIFRDVDIGK